MALGLQVFDENGNNTLDTNTDTVKILGKFEYKSSDYTFSNPLFSTETPFYIINPLSLETSTTVDDIKVTFNGSTCTVRNRKTSFGGNTVYVGVY